MDDVNGPWVEIVGVVPTSKYMYTSEPPLPFLYLPSTQHPMMRMTLVVQSAGEPLALVEPLREVVRGLDANLAIVSVRTMDDFYRDNAVGNLLVILRAIAAMGVMAVTLAFVGLYGLVADGVGRRTREIGIRMAVGATQGAVLRMILRHGLSLAVVGLAVGLVLTFGADRALQAAFPGGSAGQRGPAEYVATTIALLGITALAAYLPARRAARIEPIRALRHE
jgi:ABC-type antimicrobial peptide transport system permease subunit